jgi:serine/threonine-protein kinase HipA
MITRAPRRSHAVQQVSTEVVLGSASKALGRLVFVKDGQREFSQFAFESDWLSDAQYFDISPDLNRLAGFQLTKPQGRSESSFFLALADTAPDAWGRRVIARAHAKSRAGNPSLGPLTEFDYLASVDDFSRIGALRLRDEQGHFLRSARDGERSTPTILELEKILAASRAVELSQETAEDLAYLQGKATSLGGMRPKCTIIDSDGALALGKFPSAADERSITRGEVLALRLAELAGINSALARVEIVRGQPVAVIRRFDRTPSNQRIPYMSGASLLRAQRDDERSYTEIVDAMRSVCANFASDVRELWRRLVFNHLINNVDDHLQNIAFLYSGNNQWRLSPAFDLNPFPDKSPDSKTWLSEDTGPITSVSQLLDQAFRFELAASDAQAILAQTRAAVSQWPDLATSPEVGLSTRELADFRPAFRL